MEIKLDEEQVLKNYLSLFKIAENKFLIGVFQEGITIFKQQVRALNIFQALIKAKKIDPADKNFSIGIIGGGIAGLTFAAAAAKLDIKVTIFEKHHIYMHMQYGCDTRVVHPNIYDWPRLRSLFPYAEIPILFWKSNSATNVAKQLVHAFREIKTRSKSLQLKTFYKCTVTEIEDEDNLIKLRSFTSEEGYIMRKFNLLIFATGYGIETSVNSTAKTPSYWRNDDFAQTILTEKEKRYFLSGIGDGGLSDLFRLKILGFSLDTFLQNLKQLPTADILLIELQKIKQEWESLAPDKKKNGWLRNKFEEINRNLYGQLVKDYILDNLVEKCHVTLHGKETVFANNLNLDRMSMLNAFIAFLLSMWQNKIFDYVSGN